MVSLGYGVVVPQMPTLLGGDPGEAVLSTVFALYAGAKLVALLPGGLLSDRFGEGAMIRFSLGAFTLSLVGFAVDGPPLFVLGARTLEGAATGLLYPPLFARAARLAGGSGTSLGVLGGIGTSGFLVGPGLAALLVPALGPRAPVIIALVLSVAVTLWATVTPLPGGEAPAHRATLVGELVRLRRFVASLAFIGLTLPVAFNKLTWTAFQGLIPVVGPKSLGTDAREVALVFVAAAIAFGVGQPLGGVLADRIPPRRGVLWLMPVVVVTLPGLVSAGRSGAALAFFAYAVLGSVVYSLVVKEVALAVGGKPGAGAGIGVFQTVTDSMTVVGPPLFLGLHALVGRMTFAAMAGVGAVFFLGYAWLGGRELPHELRDEQ